MSGYKGPGHSSREAAGKMAAVSAPYAKYPPPPPLRPPGGKGKRVGFKPPPPPAQTPSSLSVSVSRARHRRDHRPCDPPDSRLLSPRPDRLRPQAAHIQPSGSATDRLPHRIDPAPHNGPLSLSLSRSCRPPYSTAGSRLPAKYWSLKIPPPLKPSVTPPLCCSRGCPEQGPDATSPRPLPLPGPKERNPPGPPQF